MANLFDGANKIKNELKSGVITRDEYFEWKINWPQTCNGCGKYEPKNDLISTAVPYTVFPVTTYCFFR